MTVRTLVAWCPDWPLVAAGIPADQPAATVHANRVVACTAAARAEGITRGLRRREAQGRCPELHIEAHDPARDARVFEPVVAAVESFTPRVEITRPGTCALPTRGPSRYFGGDEALAQRVREAVNAVLSRMPANTPSSTLDTCQVGVADGPFAASLAARRGVVIPPGGSAAFLAPLPIGLLDEPELTDLLSRLGLRTLGAFASLSTDDVVGRFGPVGVVAHRRARGLDDRALDSRVPPPDLCTEVALDPPADRVDTAAFAAKSIADGLCDTLASAGLVCTCIRVEAETEHGEHLVRIWRHHRAFTPTTVAERVRWQLEGWLTQHTRCGCPDPCAEEASCPSPAGGTTGGLTLVRLAPEEVAPAGGYQEGFWGGITESDERAGRGFARIQGLLGPDAVVTAVLGGGRGPADQVRLVPWGEPREPSRPGPSPSDAQPPVPKARRRRSTRPAIPGARVRSAGRSPSTTEIPPWPGRLPSPAPVIIPTTPIPAEVADASNMPVGVTSRSLLTAVPVRLSIDRGAWADIVTWSGPWTFDERWWDPETRHRSARFQMVLDTGAAHLVTLERGRWWIEATYD